MSQKRGMPRLCEGLEATDERTHFGKVVYKGTTCSRCGTNRRYEQGVCIECAKRNNQVCHERAAREKRDKVVDKKDQGKEDEEKPVRARTWLYDFVNLELATEADCQRVLGGDDIALVRALREDWNEVQLRYRSYSFAGHYWQLRRLAERWLRLIESRNAHPLAAASDAS